MILGFLLIGMMTGLMAGSAALILGQGVGMALLSYVMIGMGATLLGMAGSLLAPALRRASAAGQVSKA